MPPSSLPPLRLRDTVGEKQHQHNPADVIDQIFALDQAPNQPIVVFDKREIRNTVAGRRIAQDASQRAQQPNDDQEAEAEKGRYE